MKKFVVFKLGSEEFGITIKRIIEIIKSQPSYTLPELPDFINGVITVRGDVIPLVDMRKRLGIGSKPMNERVILVRIGKEKIGLLVDEVRKIASFKREEIMPPPSIFKGLRAEYLSGLARSEGRVVILLNLAQLLTSEEKMMLQASTEVLKADQS